MNIKRANCGLLCLGLIASWAWGAPQLSCDRPVYDFGTAVDEEAVRHGFRLQNVGDSDLVIDRVKTSCGCTTAQLPTKVVKPGEHVDVDCRFSLAGRRGPQTKNIYVHSNDPKQAVYKLELRGTIKHEVDLSPQQVFFSSQDADWGRATKKVTLSFHSETAYHVTGMETNGVAFANVELERPTEGSEYRIMVSLRDPEQLASGPMSGDIILLTDHPKRSRITLRVAVHKRPEVYVVPSELHLTALAARRKPVRRYILVHSDQKKPATLLDVVPPSQGITVHKKKLKPGVYRIEVGNLVPRQELEGQAIEIHLRKADGTETTIEVPIKITWRPHG